MRNLKCNKKIIKVVSVSIIILIAVFLRLYRIDSFSYSSDEASQLLDNRPLFQLSPVYKVFDSNFTIRNHDYLNLYTHCFIIYWKQLLGELEKSLRFSSVIFSLLSILIVFKIAQTYFSETAGYIAVALTATAPFHVYYAQEIRPYAAIGLFSLWAIYSFLSYLTNRRRLYFYLYIITSIINIYLSFITITITCALLFYLILDFAKNKQLLPKLVVANIFILVITSPVSICIINNLRAFMACDVAKFHIYEYPIWLQKVTFIHLMNTLKNMSVGYNIAYASLFGKIITLIYFGLCSHGVFKFRNKKEIKVLCLCFLLPILFIFILSQIKVCYVDRYFFPQSIIYLLVVAIGLSKVHRWALFILIGAIVSINVVSFKNYYQNMYPDNLGINQRFGVSEKLDIRPLVFYLAKNYRHGDTILHTWKGNVFPLKYYIQTVARDKLLIDECNRGIVIDYVRADNSFLSLEYSDLHPYVNKIDSFNITAEGLRGVWVIKYMGNEELVDYFVNCGYKQKDYKIFNRNKLYYFKKI